MTVYESEDIVVLCAPAYRLKDVKFPGCTSQCLAIKELGADECENICPRKFK